jgi:hypothetical protein
MVSATNNAEPTAPAPNETYDEIECLYNIILEMLNNNDDPTEWSFEQTLMLAPYRLLIDAAVKDSTADVDNVREIFITGNEINILRFLEDTDIDKSPGGALSLCYILSYVSTSSAIISGSQEHEPSEAVKRQMQELLGQLQRAHCPLWMNNLQTLQSIRAENRIFLTKNLYVVNAITLRYRQPEL